MQILLESEVDGSVLAIHEEHGCFVAMQGCSQAMALWHLLQGFIVGNIKHYLLPKVGMALIKPSVNSSISCSIHGPKST